MEMIEVLHSMSSLSAIAMILIGSAWIKQNLKGKAM